MMGLIRWPILLLALVAGGIPASELDPEDEAEVHTLGDIRIIDPWAKSSGTGTHAAKLFFEFQNGAAHSDKLINVRSAIASGTTTFKHVREIDAGLGVALIDGIEIPVSEKSFELTEVGYYIELDGVEVPVLMGTRVPVELTFQRAGSISIEFVTRFHSPKLTRRIRAAAARGDIEELKALRPAQ